MGIYSNAKAEALLRDLGNKLQIRLANGAGLNTVSQAFYTDANGAAWPYILVYNSTSGTSEGNPVVYIEISCVDAVSKDIFGNQLYAYAPELLQLGYELSGASGTNPIPAHADLASCEFEAIKTGVRFQLKELANGTAVTAANVNAASPVADLDELYWPTKNP
jgi:hypothetical protein